MDIIQFVENSTINVLYKGARQIPFTFASAADANTLSLLPSTHSTLPRAVAAPDTRTTPVLLNVERTWRLPQIILVGEEDDLRATS